MDMLLQQIAESYLIAQ